MIGPRPRGFLPPYIYGLLSLSSWSIWPFSSSWLLFPSRETVQSPVYQTPIFFPTPLRLPNRPLLSPRGVAGRYAICWGPPPNILI